MGAGASSRAPTTSVPHARDMAQLKQREFKKV